jgi:intein/homing endonuclease
VDKYFAELLGAFAGDGWMSKGNSSISLFISGNPKNEKEYYDKRIKFLFKKVFAKEVCPRNFPYWGTYGVCVSERRIIQAFIDEGMCVGKKARKVSVPDGVLADKNSHASFIRGLFDTDGGLSFKKSYNKNASKWQKENKHKPIVLIKTVSPKLAKLVKELLCNMGIQFSLRISPPYNGNYQSYELRIESKAKTKRFFSIIKPQSIKHLKKFWIWSSQGFYSVS